MAEAPSSPRLSARPEAPWALWAGIAGGLAGAVLSVKAITGAGGAAAAVGYLVVPFVAIAAMLGAGIWGLAAGCVWLSVHGAQRYAPPMLFAAWVLALAGPAAVGWEVWRGLALERAVREAGRLESRALDAAFERSPWNRDRFYLGALAQREDASPALLDRIASLEDPALYEPMGSLWDVMGANRKGIAVMRLVANHRNTRGETLARLANGAHADPLRHELARNPNTPAPVLARWFDSTDYLVEWGLALNPATPPAVLERLSRSANYHARFNLVRNPATPIEILDRLASDQDNILGSNARAALHQRKQKEKAGK